MNHEEFITRWQRSGGAELANGQSFLKELCRLLELPEPDPTETDQTENAYVFEKAVSLNNGDGTSSTASRRALRDVVDATLGTAKRDEMSGIELLFRLQN